MFTFIIFILILSLLVFVHEFGHFVVARKAGIRVHEFGLGMPPRLFGLRRVVKKWQWVWGNKSAEELAAATEAEGKSADVIYSINLLPLGGFVKIKGENGELMDEPDSFGSKKAWKRVLVLFAGVLMNFILAVVLLSVGFLIGLPTDISSLTDKQAIVVGTPAVLIQQVEKDSPADVAGLKFGDEIVSLDGTKILASATMTDYVRTKDGVEIRMMIKREGMEKELLITPSKFDNAAAYARIGVALADAAVVRYPWYLAIYNGFLAACFGVVNILVAFYFLIKNLIIGQGLMFDVSGPVGIAVVVGQSARMGFNYLLNTTAMISLSLAVINILPIPALDGGRILFILIEKITRRKMPMKYEQVAHTLGFVALMLLILVVTFRDVKGLF